MMENRAMKTVKLVVCDIDGTLIRRGEPFPEAVAEAVKKLKRKGIAFTFASGRLPYMIQPYLDQMGLDVPYCACNGTLLMYGKKRLESHPIAVGYLRPLIDAACKMDMTVLYAINGTEYCVMENDTVRRKRQERGHYHAIRPIEDDEWETLLVDKVNILDEKGRMPLFADREREIMPVCDITHYGNEGLELVASGYGKEYGIRFLARRFGVSTDEILAIGDNENDIAMVTLAGIGGVVANGTREAKDCADIVATAEAGEGVAEIIGKICLNAEKKGLSAQNIGLNSGRMPQEEKQ